MKKNIVTVTKRGTSIEGSFIITWDQNGKLEEKWIRYDNRRADADIWGEEINKKEALELAKKIETSFLIDEVIYQTKQD